MKKKMREALAQQIAEDIARGHSDHVHVVFPQGQQQVQEQQRPKVLRVQDDPAFCVELRSRALSFALQMHSEYEKNVDRVLETGQRFLMFLSTGT